MSNRPAPTASRLVKALLKLGFEVVRVKGSISPRNVPRIFHKQMSPCQGRVATPSGSGCAVARHSP